MRWSTVIIGWSLVSGFFSVMGAVLNGTLYVYLSAGSICILVVVIIQSQRTIRDLSDTLLGKYD
jgi:hypothetical protein